jgi:hypothetical protein
MNSQDFIRAWGGEHKNNPLARFRQALQNLQGYGELVLEEFAEDGFRPPVAADLEWICRECHGFMRAVADLLAASETFGEATQNLSRGLLPTVDAILTRVQKTIAASTREEFAGDLKNMRLAGQTLRDLLVEVSRRGATDG